LAQAEADIQTLLNNDADQDGVPDMNDAAPFQPEDFDGFEDEDGAPDPDNDQDGIPDIIDAAPLEPETINRWRDYDGAPDAYPALEQIAFAPDLDSLSDDARGYLRGLALLLVENPRLRLRIKGHASDANTPQQNLALARRRAERVQCCLIDHGVAPAQLVVTYHGVPPSPTGDRPQPRAELQFE